MKIKFFENLTFELKFHFCGIYNLTKIYLLIFAVQVKQDFKKYWCLYGLFFLSFKYF